MTTNLIGYFAHGADIEQIFLRAHKGKHELLCIYDEDPEAHLALPDKLKGDVIFGMNDPQQRQRAAARFKNDAAKPLIDPSAVIGNSVRLHRGVVVAPGAILFHHVELGQHVHVNYGASMVRAHVKSFTTISPGVTICGDVEIGKACLIGAGATICNCVTIGDDAVVAAGAVVPPFTNIPAGTIWAGVPAKQLDKDRSSLKVKHRYQRGDDE